MAYRTIAPAPIHLTLAALTDVGPQRSVNEDALAAFDLAGGGLIQPVPSSDGFDSDAGFALLVVDGMGGSYSGEEAAAIVVETFHASLGTVPEGIEGVLRGLGAAMTAASDAILSAAKRERRLTGCGAAATGAVIVGEHLCLAQVGDTRAYVLRGDRLTQVTRDHSLINDATEHGIPEDRIAELPRNIITRALGMKEGIEATLSTIELRAGDTILLCTDGLYSELGDERMERILRDLRGPSEACRALLDAAVRAGGNDNITAIVAQPVGARLRPPGPADRLENANVRRPAKPR